MTTSRALPSVADDSSADPAQSETEMRMRRALGLTVPTGGAVARRPGAPVVMHRNSRGADSLVSRVSELEAALAAERQTRERVEGQLRDVKAALHEAETRRGHAELARDEAVTAVAGERAARAAAEEAREIAEEQVRALTGAMESTMLPSVAFLDEEDQDVVPVPAEPTRLPARRGRPPGRRAQGMVDTAVPAQAPARACIPDADDDDAPGAPQAPVEWWVPGWKTRLRRNG